MAGRQIIKWAFIGLLALIVFLILGEQSEPIKSIEKKETIDTVYVPVKEIVYTDSIQIRYLRDTVYFDSAAKDPEIKKDFIKGYQAKFPTLYGSVIVEGEVLGEILKMKATTDFKIPTITNKIEIKETIKRDLSGLYAVAGAGQVPDVGVMVVRGKNLFGYRLSLNGIHSVYYGRRIVRF